MAVLQDEEFVKGNTHTRFVEERRILEKVAEVAEKLRPLKRRLEEIFTRDHCAIPGTHSSTLAARLDSAELMAVAAAIAAYEGGDGEVVNIVNAKNGKLSGWKIALRLDSIR